MKYNRLGQSNLRVSALCLGTMMFGDQTDAMESMRIVDFAREKGVNFIDTADVYSLGRSEEFTGRAIRGDRDWWVLATKVGNRTRTSPRRSTTGGVSGKASTASGAQIVPRPRSSARSTLVRPSH